MSPFFETLLGGLALAAVSAITFVAYRHPNTYAKAYSVLAVGWLFIYGLWMAFGIGEMVGHLQVVTMVKDSNEGVVNTPTYVSPPIWKMMSFPAILFYLFFLSFFPQLFPKSEDHNDDRPNKSRNNESSH